MQGSIIGCCFWTCVCMGTWAGLCVGVVMRRDGQRVALFQAFASTEVASVTPVQKIRNAVKVAVLATHAKGHRDTAAPSRHDEARRVRFACSNIACVGSSLIAF